METTTKHKTAKKLRGWLAATKVRDRSGVNLVSRVFPQVTKHFLHTHTHWMSLWPSHAPEKQPEAPRRPLQPCNFQRGPFGSFHVRLGEAKLLVPTHQLTWHHGSKPKSASPRRKNIPFNPTTKIGNLEWEVNSPKAPKMGSHSF